MSSPRCTPACLTTWCENAGSLDWPGDSHMPAPDQSCDQELRARPEVPVRKYALCFSFLIKKKKKLF